MAVLQKIRQRSLLLILIIGLSLLAFIIGDIINSGGFGGVSRNVGSVNGTNIPAQDFVQKVNDFQAQQRGASATQAANAIWNQEVDNILYGDRIEDAGIRVGQDHVFNMYGQIPQVAMQFSNAAGKFDKNKFREFLANMKASNPDQYRMFERERARMEDAAKRQIYLSMLKSGFVATDADAKAKYKEENDKVNFDYVYLPFTSINDDEVKVSDDEIKQYMKKNEKKYKAEPSRDIEYVLFENKPSAEDEAEMKKNINALLAPRVVYNSTTKANDTLPGFNAVADAKAFVDSNSDIKFDSTYVAKKDLPVEHAEQIYNLAPGQVYGPYVDNGYQKLTRVIARKDNASTKVSHVLVAYKGAMRAAETITRTKEEAKAIADGYLAQVNANPAAIDQLARTNSDDPGAVQNGGVYDVTPDGGWAEAFKNFAVNSPKGKTGVVETEFGYHVMRVLDKEGAVQLATVAQKIQPSEGTVDDVYRKATKMEMDAEGKDFAALAKENGLTVTPANRLMANDEMIQGVGNQRAIVKWAFDSSTKEGAVKRFEVPQGHVIAKLKNINDDGLMSLEEAKEIVAPILRNQKKAEKLKAKMTGGTLEAVAQKTGASVASATDVTFAAPNVPGIGPEPKVVGKAFGLAAGKTSGHIEGQTGVFMIRPKNVVPAPELPNYSSYVTRLKQQDRGGAPTRLSMAMRNKAKIEDNRAEFN